MGKKIFFRRKNEKIRKDIIEKGDKGIIKEKEMFNRLSKIIDEDSSIILKDWLKTAVINNELVDFIIQLRKKYKIALLSNASDEFLKRILKRINSDELFDCIVISSEEGIAKPSPEIFELLLSKMKIKASSTIFIDDNQRNLDAAKYIGMDGILFENIEKLKKDLLLYNVSINKSEDFELKI